MKNPGVIYRLVVQLVIEYAAPAGEGLLPGDEQQLQDHVLDAVLHLHPITEGRQLQGESKEVPVA